MRTTLTLLLLACLFTLLPFSAAQDASRQPITPDNAAQVIEQIRLGRGSADRVTYSPDGSTIAVLSSVGVWLYPADQIATPAEPPLIPLTTDLAGGMAYAPDGSILALSTSRYVQLWDPIALEKLAEYDVQRTAGTLAFSPDGSVLAVNLGSGGIVLIDPASGAQLAAITGSAQADAALVFSPDGSLLAGATTDYKIHLWNTADGSESKVLNGHTRYVYDFAFTDDMALLISASYDESVRLWDIAGAAELGALLGTEAQPVRGAYALAVSPDGSTLVSGHARGTIVEWDVNSMTPRRVFGPGDADIRDIAFSPDGTRLVAVSSLPALTLYDFASGEPAAAAVAHTAPMTAASFSPDSGTLAVGAYNEMLWLWDTASLQELNNAPALMADLAPSTRNLSWVTYAPNGSALAVSDGFDIFLLNPVDGGRLAALDDCAGTMISIAFSPDSTLVAAGSSEGVCLFSAQSGDLLMTFVTPDWLNGVTFSPDQTLIAAAGKDGTVRVYGLP